MTDELYETLNQPKWIKREIDVTKARMEKLRVMMLPGAIRYDKDSVQSTPKDPMLEFAEQLDSLDHKLKKQQADFEIACQEVKDLLSGLHKQEYEMVLTLRYIDCLSHKDIAHIMGYSVNHIYKLQSKAIKKVDRFG